MRELVLKWLLDAVYALLLKVIGHSQAAQHAQAVITKYTPLTPEKNPPLSVINNPNLKNHYE
jgi:hypothetical protein